MSPQTVLITGASGFVGSHILKAVLDSERNYKAVAVARGTNAQHLKTAALQYSDRLRVADVSDLFDGELPRGLFQDVNAMIHVATPTVLKTPGPMSNVIDLSVKGSLNLVEEARKAGVQTIVVTGTISAIDNLKGTFNNDDWNPITREEAIESNGKVEVYAASKKYAELAIWEWAEEHPDVEVTFLHPSLIIGPYIHEFYNPKPDKQVSSNKLFLGLLSPQGEFPPHVLYVDARDLARAHVNALIAPPTSDIGRKRVVFSSPHELDFKEVIEVLEKARPELRGRLNQGEPPKLEMKKLPCDFKRIEEVVELRTGGFHTVEQTLLDMYDDYLALEKKW